MLSEANIHITTRLDDVSATTPERNATTIRFTRHERFWLSLCVPFYSNGEQNFFPLWSALFLAVEKVFVLWFRLNWQNHLAHGGLLPAYHSPSDSNSELIAPQATACCFHHQMENKFWLDWKSVWKKQARHALFDLWFLRGWELETAAERSGCRWKSPTLLQTSVPFLRMHFWNTYFRRGWAFQFKKTYLTLQFKAYSLSLSTNSREEKIVRAS